MALARLATLANLALVLALALGAEWADSPALTETWSAVSSAKPDMLLAMTANDASFAQQRASDGRGPMWWAYEFRSASALALFKHLRISETDADAGGLLPADTFGGTAAELAQLRADADAQVEGIPALLQRYVDKMEEMKREQAARFEDDSVPFEPLDGDDDDEHFDEDDDAELLGAQPAAPAPMSADEIAAKVAALKAKAEAIKDEI